MAKKPQPSWQFKFTFGLSIAMFFLVIAYFIQSFQEMRKIQPVQIAIERLTESPEKTPEVSKDQAGEIGQEKMNAAEKPTE